MSVSYEPLSDIMKYKVYNNRWFITIIFVFFCIMQSAMWGFYSPINVPLEQVYGWSDTYVEWLGNTANISFCLLVIPFAALIDTHGMRMPVILTVIALMLNSGLRCIPVSIVGQKGFDIITSISMLFNGVAGTVESLSPPVLSSLWFPVHERATATAIMATANTLGTAGGFLTAFVVPSNGSNEEILAALYKVNWGMFGVCIFTFICTIFNFPSRPPLPPSLSSAVAKVDVKSGIFKLLIHFKFWVVVLCMSIPLGVYSAWLNVLGINLKEFSVSQEDAAWIGFAGSLAGALAGIISGRIADYFPGRLTQILATMYITASILILWLCLLIMKVLPFSLSEATIASVLIGVCMYGTYPLFFELAMETTFPNPPSCTSGFLVMSQSAIQAIFLAIPLNGGTRWMNYVLIICPALAAFVLLSFKVDYTRLNLDLKNDKNYEIERENDIVVVA